ncbi:hypothetical protein ABI_39070 [Asticcacaulis biprosthecium C19]|uniref:3-keto-alpha-glucoside-1,2-lyase/3-keto-2-hydroxy-glucal hydratase domain-containing protein n=1 Tax=Asticcacaulis biprosthecium C19 TaxID=715226 RepID=F4QRX3_9CAUL|nr:DUF1080 domain-containing protein [Asticcacaulis biprosthecium]EGF89493.1 hypothetical protein ABI_39070 [Asticcacaulis biprosthecium C19]
MLRSVILAGLCLLATPVLAEEANKPQTLVLKDVPAATGPAVELFNGKDIDAWDAWLGYPDPGQTYSADHAPSIGPAGKGDIFKVVTEDGGPALFISGKTWGSLVHQGDYGNYHLRLEYKWSGKRHAPRLDQPENNGLLYHSHGEPGAVWGTWMRSAEFEIMTGSTGMIVPVGANLKATTTAVKDPAIIAPGHRFTVGAPEYTTVGNTADWNVENARDAEKPVGQWNTLDLYVFGDRAIHVVNGVPVMEVWNLCDTDAAGVCQPLTHGRIQFQSEGAETFFRHITLEPIDRLPTIEVTK